MLLHYQPSYALEVLRERVHDQHGERLVFEHINGDAVDQERKQYHDALYDSFVSLGLFRYLVHKLILLCSAYPVLNNILLRDISLTNFLVIEQVDAPLRLPLLTKPYSSKKDVEASANPIILSSFASESSWYTGNTRLCDLLERTSQDQPIIYAVHTRQKLDVIKHHLHAI
jgi:hypothetical protein